MKPTIGTMKIRIHQPLRLMSCRRRIATESPGSRSASAASPLTTPKLPMMASIMLAPIPTRIANRNHHQ